MGDKTKFVIIGAGAAGVAGATTLAKSIADGHHAEMITLNDTKDNPEKLLSADVIINEYSIPQIETLNYKSKSKFHK